MQLHDSMQLVEAELKGLIQPVMSTHVRALSWTCMPEWHLHNRGLARVAALAYTGQTPLTYQGVAGNPC